MKWTCFFLVDLYVIRYGLVDMFYIKFCEVRQDMGIDWERLVNFIIVGKFLYINYIYEVNFMLFS